MTATRYVYRWKKYRPEWFMRECIVLARGRMNNAQVEFIDNGERAIVSRNALRKAKASSNRDAESESRAHAAVVGRVA